MSKIQPGMLCIVVRPKGMVINTVELLDRIVVVDRACTESDVFVSVNGCRTRSKDSDWIISANSPLPWRINLWDGGMVLEHFQERPVWEALLKPLIDPDHGVTDEEVRSLYSPSRQFSDDLITMRVSYQGNQ